jgi:glutathione synthase/RimK-type ligase-like ATP-grasp enzyme
MTRPIEVLYEHPHWFQPLFAELGRRGYPHRAVHVDEHRYRPALSAAAAAEHPLVFNRMSPSAWKRGHAAAIHYTAGYVAHLERAGVPVVNGARTFALEVSKAGQLSLLSHLGLPAPRAVVVARPELLPVVARELVFPLLVKPNVGGSGAGIVRFDDAAALADAVARGAVSGGLDGTWLLQEYHPPRERSIIRVETLAGRYLYGIRVHLGEEAGFDLCPADICRSAAGEALDTPACPVDAQKRGLTVEGYTPPAEIVAQVERIAQASHLDVGGIEYLHSARDGGTYFYDINALSNFVADAPRVVGLDPTARLVDYLVARAQGRGP